MKRPTTVGQLREQITIQRATRASDGYGGRSTSWATAYTLMARVVSVRGSEAEIDGRLSTIETNLFVIRFGPTITSKDRIQWNGRTWNINNVADREGRRMYLTIEAVAGDGA